MKVKIRKIVLLRTSTNVVPFELWIGKIKNNSYVSAIFARLTRIEDGNFGDHKSIGKGLYELRIHKGPGLRVYYCLDEDNSVVLILGGDKSTQNKDIKKAYLLLKEYGYEE